MEPQFDLLGDPIPENWGRRGRPPHLVTEANRNKVMMCLAFGWTNERIARGLGITPPTLRRCYKSELKIREEARDRLDATIAHRLLTDGLAGNVGAIKEFRKVLERSDMMVRAIAGGEGKAKEPKPGKKEQQLRAAQDPSGTPMGDLMARRMQSIGKMN
jgi:hypothetical protein